MLSQEKMPKKLRIAVIGSGIAGLSAAYTLKKGGVDVCVYEKNDRPGGRMYSIKQDNLTFDCGANFFVDAYKTMKLYANELQIEWVPPLPGGTHRVIKGGRPYYYSIGGVFDTLRFSVLPLNERIRMLFFAALLKFRYRDLSFFELYKQPLSYDFSTAEKYLLRTVGQHMVDYVADPFTAIMQFHKSDELSTGALFALFQAMLDKNNPFTIRYTKGGIDAIPRALAKKLNVQYNTTIADIRKNAEGVSLLANNTPEHFDAVIVATTAAVANELTGKKYAQEVFNEVKYSQTITLSYKISVNTFRDNAHINYVPKVENEIISGYGNEIRKGDDIRAGDTTLLTVFLHETSAEILTSKSDKEIFSIVSAELPKVCPELRDNAFTPHLLQRWPLAMPKFAHKYISTVHKFMKEKQGTDNIYFVGDYLGAPWTEGAALLGKKTAETILTTLLK
ncbi:MAG: NAD(P)/FAD-dependent oxidoreductase [bacterium]|nr:NAD(P)/FAD-dependent oxidoreductase [bacterium]